MAPDDNAGPIGLGAGISDDPGQGAELGDLNPLNRKIIQTELFDPHTSDFLAATRRVASENYVSDSLAKRGSFKGIVLRVEPPGPSSRVCRGQRLQPLSCNRSPGDSNISWRHALVNSASPKSSWWFGWRPRPKRRTN